MAESLHSIVIREHGCPRCGSVAGVGCVRPSGREAWPPHNERCRLLRPAEALGARVPVMTAVEFG